MDPISAITGANIFGWILLGLLSGYIVYNFNKDVKGGILTTMILGALGALVAGFIARVVLGVTTPGLDFPSTIIGIIGGVVLALLQQSLVGTQDDFVKSSANNRAFYSQITPNRTREKITGAGQVLKFLDRMDYPASREELITEAGIEGADDEVMHTLELLPDKNYSSDIDVSQEIGKLV